MAADKKRKKRTDEKPIRDELLDELLADYEKPEDVIGENGLLKRLTKRVLERSARWWCSGSPAGAATSAARSTWRASRCCRS